MKIFTAPQIRDWDKFTIENEPISSFDLMNRAAETFTNWFLKNFQNTEIPVVVICGTGNNGGDGLAVARMLHHQFFAVKVLVCDFAGKNSSDFDQQLTDLPLLDAVEISFLKNAETLPDIQKNAIVIEAIFGTGLDREPLGDFAKIISWINNLPNKTVSIDLPAGLFSDKNTPGLSVLADQTFSFQTPKLAFFMPENAERVGDWSFGEIGLHPDFLEKTESPFHFLTIDEVRKIIRPRQKFDHKGTFGHALLIAGSFGKMGAAVLAAKACLRSGAGLLTVNVPDCGLEILQISVPEAICLTDENEKFWTQTLDYQKFSAIGIGPGLGTALKTRQALERLLKSTKLPIVLDADTLNLISEKPELLKILPKNSILTPHPKEFERLFGKTENDFERLELLREKSRELGIFIILKGANTAIACPDSEVWFNSTGNPGMATGGSGDVLTGILTGLLAQGYFSKDAARLGVFWHGLAGDLAAEKCGEASLIAGDLIDFLGQGYLKMCLPE